MRIVLVALLFVGALSAQEVKAPPVLTDVQRLQLQYMSQQVELAQLRFTNLVLTLQIKGYTLDLQTLTYRPEPEKEQP